MPAPLVCQAVIDLVTHQWERARKEGTLSLEPVARIETGGEMSNEGRILERRIERIEARNQRLRWLAVGLAAVAIVGAAKGQSAKYPVVKAQKFELYDEAGHLSAELSLVGGKPSLRLFGEDGVTASVLSNDRFSIQTKQGGLLAELGRDGLRFEDGKGNTFLALTANDKEQRAELHLNDLRSNTHVAVTALDLDKLLKSRSQ